MEIHGQLVSLVYDAAPDETLWAVNIALDSTRFGGKLNRLLGPLWKSMQLEQLLLLKLQDSSIRPELHQELLRLLIARQADGAVEYAHSLLTLPIPTAPDLRARSRNAAKMLLVCALQAEWRLLWNVFFCDIAFGREVFDDLAGNSMQLRQISWRRLPEDVAADAYIWLEQQFPHEEDPERFDGKDYARREIGECRARLMQDLYSRGTKASVRAVERIAQAFAGKHWTQWAIGIADEIEADRNWKPLTPEEVIALGGATRTHPTTPGIVMPDELAKDARPNENLPSPHKTAYARINGSDGLTTMNRDELLDALCKLQDSELKTIIFKLKVATEVLPGENAPRAERVIKVIEWAEPRGRLAEVERLYREILGIHADPR